MTNDDVLEDDAEEKPESIGEAVDMYGLNPWYGLALTGVACLTVVGLILFV